MFRNGATYMLTSDNMDKGAGGGAVLTAEFLRAKNIFRDKLARGISEYDPVFKRNLIQKMAISDQDVRARNNGPKLNPQTFRVNIPIVRTINSYILYRLQI